MSARGAASYVLLSATLFASGCFLSRGDEDSGPDLGMGDAGVECPAYGPYRSCEGDCEALCPTRGTGESCQQRSGICYPVPEVGNDSCVKSSTSTLRYCRFGGRICALPLEQDAIGQRSGRCAAFEMCADLARHSTLAACTYSDGSVYVEGPPEEACPTEPTPDRFAEYCGPSCGAQACPDARGVLTLDSQRCVGVSETRGVGICVRSEGDTFSEEDAEIFEGRMDPVLLLVHRTDEGLAPRGYHLLAAPCRAYRDRYPADFACVDPLLGWFDADERD